MPTTESRSHQVGPGDVWRKDSVRYRVLQITTDHSSGTPSPVAVLLAVLQRDGKSVSVTRAVDPSEMTTANGWRLVARPGVEFA